MSEHRSRRVQYFATFCVSLAFAVLGMFSAWPSPVIPKFKRNETSVDITVAGISWMVAVNPIGFIIGSFVTRYTSDKLGRRATILCSAGPVAVGAAGISWMVAVNPIGFIIGSFVTRYTSDKLGRRATILCSAGPVAVGALIVAFALKAWLICISYFLWSCGTGMMSTVIGIYLAEICDKDIRATLTICTRFAFNLGNLMVMAAGPFLTYEMLNWCLLPMPFLYHFACCWIPESPYYLLKEGRVGQARKALARLRGYKDGTSQMLEEELLSMQAGVKNEMSNSSSYKELFSGKQYQRAIIIAAGIKFTQIMTGGVTIKQYLGVIMQEARIGEEYEQTVFLVFGGISFIVSIVSSALVDRVGRRHLLISSYLGTALSLATVGTYLFLLNVIQIDHDSLAVYGVIPFAGIVLSNVVSTFGFIALSVVIPAEIFPLNVKAVAMTSLSIFGGVLGFTVGKGYQNVKDLLGEHTVFWIFAAVAFGGSVFTYFIVPETKGKNLNEIQKELQGDLYQDLTEKVDVNDTELQELKRNESV